MSNFAFLHLEAICSKTGREGFFWKKYYGPGFDKKKILALPMCEKKLQYK